MKRYLFVEGEDGDDFFKLVFIKNTTLEQKQKLWMYVRYDSNKHMDKMNELIKSIPFLADRDFNIEAHLMDEDTVELFYNHDLIDYDGDKARGFVEVD